VAIVRFAIKTMPEHTTWRAMLDVWRAADDIDLFESAWNWDHFYPLTGDHTGRNFEGWTMIAAMAQATRRIRVGCQVTGMIYRHPAVLANMAATVDHISDGRLELGLGAAWNQEETTAYGIPLPPLKERFDRFDEGLDVIVGLLTQETFTYEGRYLQLTDARCEPKAVQQPLPPITIGGNGPTRTLRAVARHAQQWNSLTASPAEWQGHHDVLVERCAEIGRDPAEILCSVNARTPKDGSVKDWAAQVAEVAAAYAEVGAGLLVVNVPNPHDPADLEPLANALRPLATT
jgi:F420-dependent oxidoreductase-like protein